MEKIIGNKLKIVPNPDTEFYNEVAAAIKENNGYCCCAIERSAGTKCMCKDFRLKTEPGMCGCGRYMKVEREN